MPQQMRSPRKWCLVAAVAVALAAVGLLPALEAKAQPTFVVTATADPLAGSCAGGTGSLRQCLAAAAAVPGSVVTFSVNGVFTLTQGQLYVNSQLTIQGNGPANTIIDGNHQDRVLMIDVKSIVSMSGVTVRNGLATDARGGQAGGILDVGQLTLVDSAVTGNSTASTDNGEGGGILDSGTLVMTGSTVSGNSATVQNTTDGANVGAIGGGIFMVHQGSGPQTTLINDTITGNHLSVSNSASSASAQAFGAGIFDPDSAGQVTNVTITGNSITATGTVEIRDSGVESGGNNVYSNTIVAGNTGAPQECRGIREGGYNLDDNGICFSGATDLHANPLLGPLADNGGPTMTQALLPGSPAIDAVGAGCPPPTADQRGVSRPQGPACDIGAFEVVMSGPPATTTTAAEPTTTTAPGTTTTSTAPTITCFVTGLIAGPPKQQQVTVQSSAGLATIHSINITNGTVSVAPFTAGTTGPVVVTATKTDQSQRTSWNFVATDINGFSQFCG